MFAAPYVVVLALAASPCVEVGGSVIPLSTAQTRPVDERLGRFASAAALASGCYLSGESIEAGAGSAGDGSIEIGVDDHEASEAGVSIVDVSSECAIANAGLAVA